MYQNYGFEKFINRDSLRDTIKHVVEKGDTLYEIAKKYNATIPQICVRYCIQKGAIPIPKSTKEERIISNVHVDFVMSDEDMEYLDKK